MSSVGRTPYHKVTPCCPQTPPDDCVLLAESLPAFEVLKHQKQSSADYLLPCQPVARCFLVSLHLLFVLSLGMSVLTSAVFHGERLPSQATWRSLPAGEKALCSAIVAPFLEPVYLDLHHSTVHETLVHRLFCTGNAFDIRSRGIVPLLLLIDKYVFT